MSIGKDLANYTADTGVRADCVQLDKVNIIDELPSKKRETLIRVICNGLQTDFCDSCVLRHQAETSVLFTRSQDGHLRKSK